MSKSDLDLVRLLAEKIGITTAKQLEEFKAQTQADTNEELLKRLALYVACGMKYGEAIHYK